MCRRTELSRALCSREAHVTLKCSTAELNYCWSIHCWAQQSLVEKCKILNFGQKQCGETIDQWKSGIWTTFGQDSTVATVRIRFHREISPDSGRERTETVLSSSSNRSSFTILTACSIHVSHYECNGLMLWFRLKHPKSWTPLTVIFLLNRNHQSLRMESNLQFLMSCSSWLVVVVPPPGSGNQEKAGFPFHRETGREQFFFL